jgi:ABC-type transport system substrate-binding protein
MQHTEEAGSMTWNDGQPEDARDVDFTWRLVTNPAFMAATTVGLNLITSADVSPDHLAITFHLKQAFEPFLAVWADGQAAPLPAHQFSRIAPDAILEDLQSGSVDSAWFLDVTKTPAYKQLSTYTLSSNPKSTNFEAIFFNFRNPMLGKYPEIRRAMATAIDHHGLIATARRGQATPLCTDHSAAGLQCDPPDLSDRFPVHHPLLSC